MLRRLVLATTIAAAMILGTTASTRADLVLTVENGDSSLELSIDITPDLTGSTYTYSMGPTGASFEINGVSYTDQGPSPNAVLLTTKPASSTQVTFASHAFGAFDTSVTITLQSVGDTATLTSSTTTKTTGISGAEFIILASDTLDAPAGSLLGVTNQVMAGSLGTSSTASFTSALNNVSTASASVSTAGGSDQTSKSYQNIGAPYTLSNTLTLMKVSSGDSDGVTGTTTVAAVPEPTSIALVLSGLSALGLLWACRRPRD